MAKIDFNKVEQSLGEAMHCFFMKKLIEGQATGNLRGISYLGQQIDKPGPQDSVIQALVEMEKDEEEQVQEEPIAQEEPVDKIDELVSFSLIKSSEPDSFADQEVEAIPPIFILRKRILWFIRKRVANIYKLLGTSKEEISSLRKKPQLSEAESQRVDELLKKSAEINQLLNKKLGLENDDTLVAIEKKKHLTKRFNVRETWLPL